MNSAQIQQLAEDIDTAICFMVNGILLDQEVGAVDAATVCIAIAGLQQGRVDKVLEDGEARTLFETFRKHGADRLAALKRGLN